MAAEEKKVIESRTEMNQMVMPNDTNPLGNLMGGNLMRWMDIAASICAGRHAESHVVTASVDHISFHKPIQVGDVVTLHASVTRAFNTSLEVYVEVLAANVKGKNSRRCNHAYFTFVALDDDSQNPVEVPKILPLTNEEQKLYDGAAKRRELRLLISGKIEASEAIEMKDFFSNIKQ